MDESGTNAAPGATDRNRWFLVVDSDSDSLHYTAALLKRLEYKTIEAETARAAVQMATSSGPNLIITSLVLKDMSAAEFIRQLKQNARTERVPVIALRRRDDPPVELDALPGSAVPCLDRPVSPERLYRSVQLATETTPRKSIRIRTLQPVKVENVQLNEGYNTCTTHLSERGMFLRTEKFVPLNTRLSLKIYLYGAIIPVEAVVLNSSAAGGGPCREPGMGLEFISVEPNDRELLRRFICHEVTRGIVRGNA
jgi:CheY-like chemotaxis protein